MEAPDNAPVTEAELKARSTSPRLTPEHIESLIVAEFYSNGLDGIGPLRSAIAETVIEALATTTICRLVLKDGYSVIGSSACLDRANYKEDIGRRIARENAVRKVWDGEAYLAKCRMSGRITEFDWLPEGQEYGDAFRDMTDAERRELMREKMTPGYLGRLPGDLHGEFVGNRWYPNFAVTHPDIHAELMAVGQSYFQFANEDGGDNLEFFRDLQCWKNSPEALAEIERHLFAWRARRDQRVPLGQPTHDAIARNERQLALQQRGYTVSQARRLTAGDRDLKPRHGRDMGGAPLAPAIDVPTAQVSASARDFPASPKVETVTLPRLDQATQPDGSFLATNI